MVDGCDEQENDQDDQEDGEGCGVEDGEEGDSASHALYGGSYEVRFLGFRNPISVILSG